jgi:hypothetical protein
LNFIRGAEDVEMADPDGDTNTDGGDDLPKSGKWIRNAAQQWVLDRDANNQEIVYTGDSLTNFQEYRGFILDGGGYNWTGGEGHTPGHRRLAVAFKEMLVEADIMARTSGTSSPPMITTAAATQAMNSVAVSFSDRDRGSGVRLFWIIDDPNVPKHEVFANLGKAYNWAISQRKNDNLKEFVHLSFVDGRSDALTQLGVTVIDDNLIDAGSFIHVRTIEALRPGNVAHVLAFTAAHELTHTLLDVFGPPPVAPYGDREHLQDPNDNGVSEEDVDPVGGLADTKYLMYAPDETPPNPPQDISVQPRFAIADRRNINLRNKECVER